MADIKVTGSANFSAVTNGLKKIGAESANVSKSSSRAGLSIMALGQGLEDFSAAGMRGAMNNIPQFIQMLGAGAGIAGGATIALVAINELVKGLDSFLTARHKLKEDEAAKGFGYLDSKLTEEQLARVDAMTKKASESMRDLRKEFERGESMRGFKERGFASDSELSVAKAIAQMEKQGASDQEVKVAGIQEEIRLLNVRKSLVEESIRSQRQVPAGIQAQIAEQQKIVDQWKAADAAKEKAYEDARKSGYRSVSLTQMIYDPETGVGIEANKSAEDLAKDRADAIKRAVEAANAEINKNGQFDAAKIAGEAARQQIEILTKKLTAEQESLYLAEANAKVTGKELANQQEILRIKERQAKLEEGGGTSDLSKIPILGGLMNGSINKLLDAANFDRGGSAAWLKSFDVSGMLSSTGRIGGSGAEFNSAVATVNYQRDALKELRDIARNTRKGNTYN